MNVGEYTVFTIGNPLRNLKIHSFWAENTQVEYWRIHSFRYRKSLKEPEMTQFWAGFGWRLHDGLSETTQFSQGVREWKFNGKLRTRIMVKVCTYCICILIILYYYPVMSSPPCLQFLLPSIHRVDSPLGRQSM